MGINVKFYNFAKKENSTAQPSGTALAEFKNVLIKTGSGIIAPSLEIATAETNVSSWNYCYISDWSRYYYVMDATYDNGQWIFHLVVDVLASFKTDIGNSSQYIARCSYTSDGTVIDTAYPTKAVITKSEATTSGTDMLLSTSWTAGAAQYVVGIVNNDSQAQIGGVSYYAMTSTELGYLKTALLSSIDYMGSLSDVNLTKAEVNPFQYIVSCKYMPFAIGTETSDAAPIALGWWHPNFSGTMIHGKRILGMQATKTGSISIPKHPQEGRGSYLNLSPYSTYSLIYGNFGEMQLDPLGMKDSSSLGLNLHWDPITGMANLKAYGNSTVPIAEANANIGVDIALSQLNINLGTETPKEDAISSVASSVPILGSFVSGAMNLVSRVKTLWNKNTRAENQGDRIIDEQNRTHANNIGLLYGYNKLTSAIAGTNGNLMANQQHSKPTLYSTFLNVVDEDLNNYGRPLCAVKKISTIPGFIKCAHAELPLSASQQEQANVIGYMEGGFYYE